VPEGDSIYRLARRLDRSLAGQRVVRSELRVPAHATADLAGSVLLGHDSHGKHLLTRFDSGLTLHTHLRMDGSWTVTRPERRLPRRLMPDVRVVLGVGTGATAYGVLLPVVDLVPTTGESQVIGHLGPDPLRDDWDPDEAVRRLAADPTRPLAAALLDQTLVAGWGNARAGPARRPSAEALRDRRARPPGHDGFDPPGRAALCGRSRRPAVPAVRDDGPRGGGGPGRPRASSHLVVSALPARSTSALTCNRVSPVSGARGP
jgi:hypothetical protein